MKQYPVSVPRKDYHGADLRKRRKVQEYNQGAARVEEYINAVVAKWDDDTVGSILSYQVAAALGGSGDDLIHRIVSSIEAGANGVTVWKGDYERAMSPAPSIGGVSKTALDFSR